MENAQDRILETNGCFSVLPITGENDLFLPVQMSNAIVKLGHSYDSAISV